MTISTGVAPEAKKTKLVVLAAFDKGEDGELVPAFEPREMPSEERAVREARQMASRHVGVIAWSRPANPKMGEYGEPVLLFQFGDVPEMD
jgi:hypothetical protein